MITFKHNLHTNCVTKILKIVLELLVLEIPLGTNINSWENVAINFMM